jgi:hypothetical protein
MKSLQFLACSIAVLIPVAVSVNAGPLDQGSYKTRPGYTPAPSTPPLELQRLLTEGQAALMKNDLATAKADFTWVLQIDPHNKTAIGYLRRIALQEGQQNKGAALEKQLDGLVIPKLDFKEATLGSALDYMKKAADRISGGKVAVSFVVEVPADQVNSQPVTLSLSNIPFTEALRYIGGVAGLNFSYEKYAIVVRPNGSAAPTATAPAAPGLPGATDPSVVLPPLK